MRSGEVGWRDKGRRGKRLKENQGLGVERGNGWRVKEYKH